MTKKRLRRSIRHSCFVIPSTLVLRHSSFTVLDRLKVVLQTIFVHLRCRAVGFSADGVAHFRRQLRQPRRFLRCLAGSEFGIVLRRVVGRAAVVLLLCRLLELQSSGGQSDVVGLLSRLYSRATGSRRRRTADLGFRRVANFLAGLVAGLMTLARFVAFARFVTFPLALLLSGGLGRFGGGFRTSDLLRGRFRSIRHDTGA